LTAGSFIAPADAANTRSFVSATNGSDSNPCNRAAPCRTFQVAYANTVTGGEINTLDPGGYGPLTIGHSISVVSGLGEAGVLVPPGGDGITINAGPTDKINLRGLIVEGAGAGSTGISFLNGGSLTISNVVVRNNVSSGIAIGPTADAKIAITSSLLADNGGHGVYIQPSSGPKVRAVFTRVEAYNNTLDGFGVFGNFGNPSTDINAICVSCISINNGQNGYEVLGSATGGATLLILHDSTGTYNNIDATADYGTIVLEQSGGSIVIGTNGTIISYSDNYIGRNLTKLVQYTKD
jgi:hypothetical protein